MFKGGDTRLQNSGGVIFNAERLMRTELARVQTAAQKASFEANGFTQYEYIANSRCCEACQALDGKHFDVADMMPGENAAPLHPNCRCSVAAYDDGEEYQKWLKEVESEEKKVLPFARLRGIKRQIAVSPGEGVHRRGRSHKTVRVKNSTFDIYLSEQAYARGGALKASFDGIKRIDENISHALDMMEIKKRRMPRIVILDEVELDPLGKYAGGYNAQENALFISNQCFAPKGLAELQREIGVVYPDHPLSFYIHELQHWQDAKEFRKEYGEITSQNRHEYFQFINERANIKLEDIKLDLSTLLKQSRYAREKYDADEFDEVFAEYMAWKILKEERT